MPSLPLSRAFEPSIATARDACLIVFSVPLGSSRVSSYLTDIEILARHVGMRESAVVLLPSCLYEYVVAVVL